MGLVRSGVLTDGREKDRRMRRMLEEEKEEYPGQDSSRCETNRSANVIQITST